MGNFRPHIQKDVIPTTEKQLIHKLCEHPGKSLGLSSLPVPYLVEDVYMPNKSLKLNHLARKNMIYPIMKFSRSIKGSTKEND